MTTSATLTDGHLIPESAIVGQDRDDSKAVVVVLLARSPGGLQLAKEVARLCVSHAPVGQTVTANEVQERLGPDARIDDAAGRVAFSEVVAEILLSKPSAAIVLDDTAFAAVPGALTTLHTCWDVRGKLTGPRLGETTCHQSTFVVVVDESSDNPEASATTQEAKMNCDPRGECSSYDKHLVAAKARLERCEPIFWQSLTGALMGIQEWFSRHVLPPSREAAEVEAQALLRRLSDVVVFV